MLFSRSEHIADTVLSAVAASGQRAVQVRDAAAASDAWRSAAVVFVGDDCAADLVAAGVEPRARVHLVARTADAARWSAPLAAAVIVLPDVGGWVTAALGDGRVEVSGHVVACLSGHGGAGASTLAAALAVEAARGQRAVALVDADPLGGGLDLMVGAERVPGWRWGQLAAASGHLSDLRGRLPNVEGVDLVSMGQDVNDPEVPRPAVAAVVDVLTDTHDLVVVDAGRGTSSIAREALRRSRHRLCVVMPDVRAVAACAVVLRQVEDADVVVRTRRRADLSASVVADHLDRRLAGTVRDDPAVRRWASLAEPPGVIGGRGFRADCAALLTRLAGPS